MNGQMSLMGSLGEGGDCLELVFFGEGSWGERTELVL